MCRHNTLKAIRCFHFFLVHLLQELDYPDPNFIVVYDLQSGAIFKKWQADSNTTCVAISSEGNCVVSGHEGGGVLVWDLIGGSNKSVLFQI